MSPKEIEVLAQQVDAELTGHLLDRARIDEHIQRLRAERKLIELRVSAARSMLRFADVARAKFDIPPIPVQSELPMAEALVPPVDQVASTPTRETPTPTLAIPLEEHAPLPSNSTTERPSTLLSQTLGEVARLQGSLPPTLAGASETSAPDSPIPL